MTPFLRPRDLACSLILTGAIAALCRADTGAHGDTLELPSVLTTGSKAPRRFADSPVPAAVVDSRQMDRMGAVRLTDVLAEQTGLNIIQDHGTGVQMQGLDPAYTLILVDGDPVVGRTAGTLDLDRLQVGGLDRVEILEGPSSSLYGSEALGGVINLITRDPVEPLSGFVQTRVGTYNTFGYNALDLSAGLEAKRGATGVSLFAAHTSSEGYDLDPSTTGKTGPRYDDYTFQHKVAYDWSDRTRFTLASRFYDEADRNQADYVIGNTPSTASEKNSAHDWGVSGTMNHRFSPLLSWTLKGYVTGYGNRSDLTSQAGDSTLSDTHFDELHYKAESYAKLEAGGHALIAGGGAEQQSMHANYVASRTAYSGFGFAQDDWKPNAKLLLQASGRLDAHQDYAAHFSPKLAALYRPWRMLGLRASVGNGFKAPTFQELYDDWTNPQEGYSAFGATIAHERIDSLRAHGQIQSDLQTGAYGTLRPENSWAFNAGAEITPGKRLFAKINFFRNNVRDLIESAPVAIKSNDHAVYTFFNLKRIHTEGFETEASLKPLAWLTLSTGYQFLIAEDDDVLDSIAAGRIYKVGSTGQTRPVQRVEYGGLFNRSRNSWNAKADVETGRPGFSASLRAIYRGRYGYQDVNGNGILDDDREYARGYFLWNATCSQKITRFAVIQLGVDNLLDEHAPAPVSDPVPTLPGRRLYASLRLRYF